MLLFSALRHKAYFKELFINFIVRRHQSYFLKEIAVKYNRSKLYTVIFYNFSYIKLRLLYVQYQ